MKINEQKGVLDSHLGGPDAVRQRSGTTPAPGRLEAPAGDRVSVSDGARELARLRAAVGDVDGIRSERVEALRAEVSAGRYQVDLEATARKLLGELLGELLG